VPKRLLIAIDGPAGAGKTSVSRKLAEQLGYTYVDTGALYRAVAIRVEDMGIRPDDDTALEEMLSGLTLRYEKRSEGPRVLADDIDVTDRIRDPKITMLASAVSARPVVREFLLGVQRQLGNEKAAVFEGRDMGTVVFPDADVKFFLIADIHERARRRFRELPPDPALSLETVEQDMIRRDRNDSTRDVAPLKPAVDAVCIDSTELSIEEVVDRMVTVVHERMEIDAP